MPHFIGEGPRTVTKATDAIKRSGATHYSLSRGAGLEERPRLQAGDGGGMLVAEGRHFQSCVPRGASRAEGAADAGGS